MMVEKINEALQTNIKAVQHKHKRFYKKCPCVFGGLNSGVENTAVGRDIWYASVDCFS